MVLVFTLGPLLFQHTLLRLLSLLFDDLLVKNKGVIISIWPLTLRFYSPSCDSFVAVAAPFPSLAQLGPYPLHSLAVKSLSPVTLGGNRSQPDGLGPQGNVIGTWFSKLWTYDSCIIDTPSVPFWLLKHGMDQNIWLFILQSMDGSSLYPPCIQYYSNNFGSGPPPDLTLAPNTWDYILYNLVHGQTQFI